ncbi:MAG: hypothetical protein NDI90_07015 [Nitrospira sp. BO4]|jgi:hypothetical protein|nr:hypothetical protein [Nitrospira sp. BO4]
MHTQRSTIPLAGLFFFILLLSGLEQTGAKDFNPDNPLNQPAPVYWCPGKTSDQQISTKKSSDCQPLYDQETVEAFRESARKRGFDLPERDPIKIVELQNAASKFSDRYRTFLSCCMTGNDAPEHIIDLIDEANHILQAVQQKGIYNSTGFGKGQGATVAGPGNGTGNGGLGGGAGVAPKLGTFARQFTLGEIVGTVARAREDLFRLKTRLDTLNEAQESLSGVDYESSGRVKVKIQEEEEAIRREFQAKKPPSSAPTGMEIQDTTLRSRIGGDIEDTKLNSQFGADINSAVSPYSRVSESLRPRRGNDIHDSNLPHRPGTDIQDTVVPNSTGFEVDKSQNYEGTSTVPRRGVGASIGDSDLNSRRR